MKNFILSFLILILIGEGITLVLMHKEKPNEKVLAEITVVTQSPTPSPTPTSTPIPTPIPTPKPTPVKTPTPVPQPKYNSQQINEFINRFSAQYSVDPNVIRHIALCESGFNPSAKMLSYAGLFQFSPSTWINFRKQIGEDTDVNLRFNAEEAVQTASFAVSIGSHGIWPNCYP